MIYYAVAALFPLLINYYLYYRKTFSGIDEVTLEKSKKRLLVLAVLPMALLYALRYKKIGNDTVGYARFFEIDVRKYSFVELLDPDLHRTEIGYRLYAKLISYFTDNYTVYFTITAIIIFGVLIRFAYKYTKNPFVVLYMFMTLGTYSFYESGLRQALAMTLCLLAVDFAQEKKLIRFVITVLLGALFHKSAYIFLIIYPFTYIKNHYLRLILNIFAGGIGIVGFAFFQDWFNELLGYNYEIEETGNGQIFALLVAIIVIFSMFVLSRERDPDIGQNIIVQMALFSLIFWLLRLISRTAERISYYYMFGMYVYFSQTFIKDKDKLLLVARLALLGAFFVLFFMRNSGAVYKFFWQGA